MSGGLTAAPGAAERGPLVLATLRALVEELSPRAAARITLDSRLERDLGLDSLALVELIGRLEAACGVSLPDGSLLLQAVTPRDLLEALGAASGEPASGEPASGEPASGEPASGPPAPLGEPPLGGPAERSAGGAWAPEEAGTLTEVLAWHAGRHPDRPHIRLLGAASPDGELTYGALAASAGAAAARMRRLGVGPGDRVALMLPTGLDYFVAFCGALLAGAVAVPIYPPARLADIEDHLRRQAAILDNAGARLLVSVPEAGRAAQLLRLRVPTLHRVVTPAELGGRDEEPGGPGEGPRPGGEWTALLQYTSGSTSQPKGVVLTHANLLASIRTMGVAAAAGPGEVVVSWLPLYHDMGLIGAWMASLYYGWPLILMAPQTFLVRPQRWFEAISRYRGTISAAPNFAYELCIQRLAPDDLAGIDLSSWRIAVNGAEPITARTIRRFTERFAPAGFRSSAMYPVYGLAEASLGLTFPTPGRDPVIDRVAREPLAASGRARPAAAGEPAVEVVGCGHALPGFGVRIVDGAGEPAGERQEGRIEFRGPSATSGYFRNPAATRALVHDGWLDTGDLGYLAGGELFVTGRVKDLIIRGGRNVHPQSIEEALGELPGIRRGRTVAFAAADPEAGTERLVVVAETREREEEARGRIREAVIAACVDAAGLPPDDVVLAAPGTIPKTSSGKLRRADCRQRYEAGRIGEAPRPVWRQLAGLAGSSVLLRARRIPQAVAAGLYGAYTWVIVGLVAPAVWVLLAAAPTSRRWPIFRAGARGFLLLCGARPAVQGADRLPPAACVVVANHASVLDGLVLAACLPGPLVFPVAGELASGPVTGPFLRRLSAAFVDRQDRTAAAGTAGELLAAARAGAVLAFFPEGTMSRVPGLHPFRMGAFLIGAEAGVPVVPVAIRGTGAILRGDRRFPRRGRIEVEICPPLEASERGWPAAVALRDAARRALLAATGEADLDW
jgi:1-acyl-sn-glycerol-3-phosphate acyltransferase